MASNEGRLTTPVGDLGAVAWQAQWAQLKEALASAGLAPEEDRGDLWLAKLTELTGAEWTHPNQISPEAAAEVFQMLTTPTADEATGEIVDEPTA